MAYTTWLSGTGVNVCTLKDDGRTPLKGRTLATFPYNDGAGPLDAMGNAHLFIRALALADAGAPIGNDLPANPVRAS